MEFIVTTNRNPLVNQLLNATGTPCLSLYLATHRTQPERRDDQTRYRALVRRLSESLALAYPANAVNTFIEPFLELGRDENFWNGRKEGVAVFSSPDLFIAHHLDRPVSDLAIVADSFHVKPLLRIIQTLERYHVLTLTREHARLYIGDRDGLSEVDLGPDVPMTMEQALGSELTQIQHRESTIQEEIDLDTERFFRSVDRSILDLVSRSSGLPVILAGLPDQLSVFHRIRHNPNVLLESVTVHPDGLPLKELVKRSWEIMAPFVRAEAIRAVDHYHEAASHERGLDHVVPITHAASEGRVATLFVEATRQVPGKIDAVTAEISFDDLDQPDMNDVLDDLAVLVLRKGGQVLVLPTEHMPTATGAAAVLRY